MKRTVEERNKLVSKNLRLVKYTARRLAFHVPLEDRIQEGVTGLIKAANKYDPLKGKKFGSYAVYWIRQAIQRMAPFYDRGMHLPINSFTDRARLKRVYMELTKKLQRKPTVEELVEITNFPVCRVKNLMAALCPCGSMPADPDENSFENSARIKSIWGCSDISSSGMAEQRRLKEALFEAVKDLPKIQRDIIYRSLEYPRGKPVMSEIARELGFSREWIRRLYRQALDTLRPKVRKMDLDYLSK